MLLRPSKSSSLGILLYMFIVPVTAIQWTWTWPSWMPFVGGFDACTHLKTKGPDLMVRIKTQTGVYDTLVIAGNYISQQSPGVEMGKRSMPVNGRPSNWIERPYKEFDVGEGSFGQTNPDRDKVWLYYRDPDYKKHFRRIEYEYDDDKLQGKVLKLEQIYFDYDYPGHFMSYTREDESTKRTSEIKDDPLMPIPHLFQDSVNAARLNVSYPVPRTVEINESSIIRFQEEYPKSGFPNITSNAQSFIPRIWMGLAIKRRYMVAFDKQSKRVHLIRWFDKIKDKDWLNNQETDKLLFKWNVTFENFFVCAKEDTELRDAILIIFCVALGFGLIVLLDFCCNVRPKRQEKERKSKTKLKKKKRKKVSDSKSPEDSPASRMSSKVSPRPSEAPSSAASSRTPTRSPKGASKASSPRRSPTKVVSKKLSADFRTRSVVATRSPKSSPRSKSPKAQPKSPPK